MVYFYPGARAGLAELAGSALPSTAVSSRAMADHIGQIAAATAIFLAAWGYGGMLFRLRWLSVPVVRGIPGGLEGLLTATGLGLGGLSLAALGLSALGLLGTPALVVVVTMGVALAAMRVRRQPLRRPSLPAGCLERALLALIAVGAAFALIGALAPEVEYDALWYHLEFPTRYLAAGSLVDFPGQYVAQYPMGNELLFAYGLALDGQIAAKLIHFGFGALAILAVYLLGVRIASRRAALLAAAILIATPTFLWEATTAYVDLATACFVTLALIWLLHYAEERSRSAIVFAGLFLGFALAGKNLALIAALPLAGLVFLTSTGGGLARRLRAVGAFAAVALAPALPWYLRAQIDAGDPVFPLLYHVFGADPRRWTSASDAGFAQVLHRFGFHNGLTSFLRLPWDTTMHGDAFQGSLGVGYLMLVPFALGRRLPRGILLTGLFCLIYAALWAAPVSSLQLRYLMPVLGPLAVLAGYGFDRAVALADGLAPSMRVAVMALVVIVLALSLPPFLRMNERDRKDGSGLIYSVLREVPLDVVTGAESPRDYLTRRVPAYAAILRLNTMTRSTDHVVTSIDPEADFYLRPLAVPDYAVSLAVAGLTGDGSRSDYLALRHQGIGYLLVENRLKRDSVVPWSNRAFEQQYLEIVYADSRARLYRLRERPAR